MINNNYVSANQLNTITLANDFQITVLQDPRLLKEVGDLTPHKNKPTIINSTETLLYNSSFFSLLPFHF
jgi:hypothetical protein